jgi:hypothetical protein
MPRVPAWAAAAAFVAGVGTGAFLARSPPNLAVGERAADVAVAPQPVRAAEPKRAPEPTEEAPPARSAANAAVPTIAIGDLPAVPAVSANRAAGELGAERALLDIARTALGRGDGANALANADDHARRFPRGALSEEREAIAVQALLLERRRQEAKDRAERFRRAYPKSILLPAVLAAAEIDR